MDPNQQNIKNGDRIDKLSQSYVAGPSNYRSSGLETMGRLQGKQQLYNSIDNDRLQSMDVKHVLQGNPYALSITK